jgi:hypothetical protein
MDKALFKNPRACVCCGTDGKGKAKLLSISVYMYRSGKGSAIKAGKRVMVCEDCFATQVTNSRHGAGLWRLMQARLIGVYKAITADSK